jgi:hypothetical protein
MFRPGVGTIARLDPATAPEPRVALNPGILQALGGYRFPPSGGGMTLDQVRAQGLLLSSPGPAYDALFTDPNSNAKLTLPRWKINAGVVGGQAQRLVSLAPVPGQANWKLTVHLTPDSENAPAGSEGLVPSPPLPALPTVALQYLSGTTINRPFQEVSRDADGVGVVAVLTIGDGNFDLMREIKQAMTDAHFNCLLLIGYSVGIATLLPAGSGGGGGGRPPIITTMRPVFLPGAAMESAPMRAEAAPMRAEAAPMRPEAGPSPVPMPGFVLRPPIDRIPIDTIPILHFPPFGTTAPPPPPVTTPAPFPITTPPPVATTLPPQPTYAQSTATPTFNLPFIFDSSEPVFQNLGGTSGGPDLSKPLIYPLAYKGVTHFYLQVRTVPNTFFYLPDSFKLCRRAQPPFYPVMTVTVSGDNADTSQLTLNYVAVPVTDPARIKDAQAQLAVQGVTEAGQRVVTPDTKFFLAVPGTKPEDGPNPLRNGVVVDLAGGFRDTLTLPVNQFSDLFDSLFTDAGSYFQGFVTAHLDESTEPQIRFIARATDLVAFDLLDHAKSLDPDSGGLKMVLSNGTEAPLHVEALASQLRKGDGTPVESRIVSINPPLPCDLVPATTGQAPGSIEVILAPTSGTAADDWDIAFDLSRVSSKPDRESFWSAIVDQSVTGHLNRTVRVCAPKAIFAKGDSKYLIAAQVQFEGGATVTLDNGSGLLDGSTEILKVDAQLPVSVSDFLLRKTVGQPFRYKRKLIFSDGTQVTDTGWTQDAGEPLFPSFAATPVT